MRTSGTFHLIHFAQPTSKRHNPRKKRDEEEEEREMKTNGLASQIVNSHRFFLAGGGVVPCRGLADETDRDELTSVSSARLSGRVSVDGLCPRPLSTYLEFG